MHSIRTLISKVSGFVPYWYIMRLHIVAFICGVLILFCGCRKGSADMSGHVIAQGVAVDADDLSATKLLERGNAYDGIGKPDSAILYFKEAAFRVDDKMSDKERRACVWAMNNIGCVLRFSFYDYEKSYEWYRKTEEACNKYGYPDIKGGVYSNMATLLSDPLRRGKGEHISHTALGMYREAIRLHYENRNWVNLGLTVLNLSEHEPGIALSEINVVNSPDIPDSIPEIEYCRLLYKGLEAMRGGRYSEAREFFRKQMESPVIRKGSRGLLRGVWISPRINGALSYVADKKYGDAIKELDEALDISGRNRLLDYRTYIQRVIGDVWLEAGDSIKAKEWHIRYLLAVDSLMNTTQIPSVQELNLAYAITQRQEELKIERLSNTYLTRIITVCVILVVMGVLFIILLRRKNRQLRERNQALYHRNDELMQAHQDISDLLRNCEECQFNGTQPSQPQEEQAPVPKERDEVPMESAGDGMRTQSQDKVAFQLSEKEKFRIFSAIDRIMNDRTYICNRDFSLSTLVQLVGSNNNYVSKVIKEKYHITFPTLLGNARIREACRQFHDGEYDSGSLTLEALSEKVGFKSRSTFIAAFKRVTGMSPSEYRALMNRQNVQ